MQDLYRPAWKIMNGYFDWNTLQLFDDSTCDWYEDMHDLWRKNLERTYERYSKYQLKKMFGLIEPVSTLPNGLPEISKEELLDKIDIVDLIGGYAKLRKYYDKTYKALCPFHVEKTPSLNVNRKEKLWYCFGCGKGGDMFTFVMEIYNCDFKSAFEALSKL